MKKTILLLLSLSFVLLINPLQANEIRAGAISLKQLTTLNVEATVQIVVPSHSDVTDLELCWGDGFCSNLQEVNESINTAQGLKYYTFTDVHTYPAIGNFTTSINHCCFDGAISNIENGAASNFQIETTILLLESFLNATPTFTQPQSLADVDIATGTLVLIGADADAENDEYSNEFCEPENVINYTGIDFFNSTLTLVESGGGGLAWSNPGFEGVYIVQICTEESRSGSVISSSKRIVLLVVDNDFVSKTTELSDAEMVVYPNPVSEGKLYLERKGELRGKEFNVLLINQLGIEVFAGEWKGADELAIEIGHLPTGNYTVVLSPTYLALAGRLEDGRRYYKKVAVVHR